MVVGRLPKVDNGKQIADVYNAGYHIEIDGSDLNSEAIMLQSFTGIASQLQPGHGVTFNCSFSDQELWSIQFPTVLRMCKEGMPIAGICVGDCVPPLKAIVGVIGTLGAAGVRHVSFKPKDADEILQVVRIAQASNGFPILLQWAHKRDAPFSFDGFVRPLLETYAAVRSCNNLAIAVESRDTSDFSDALPYFTGEWSSKYGRIPMPIDGVLLDSSSFTCSLCEKGRAVPTGQIVYNGKDITSAMDGLYRSVVASVIEQEYVLDESRVPTVEYIGNDPRKVLLPDSVHVESSTSEEVFELPDDANSLPEHEIWLQALGGGRKSWLQQLLTIPVVIQGNR
ncbi:fatty acid synthase alpha subunit Lsd1, partial [Coemansia sp. IMI 209127]